MPARSTTVRMPSVAVAARDGRGTRRGRPRATRGRSSGTPSGFVEHLSDRVLEAAPDARRRRAPSRPATSRPRRRRPGSRAERRPRAAPGRAFPHRDAAQASQSSEMAISPVEETARIPASSMPSGRDSVEPTRVVKISLRLPVPAGRVHDRLPVGSEAGAGQEASAGTSASCASAAAPRGRAGPAARWPARNASTATPAASERGRDERRAREPQRAARPAARSPETETPRSGRAARRDPAPGPWSSRTDPRDPSPDSARRPRRGSSAVFGASRRERLRLGLDDRRERLRGGRALEGAPARRPSRRGSSRRRTGPTGSPPAPRSPARATCTRPCPGPFRPRSAASPWDAPARASSRSRRAHELGQAEVEDLDEPVPGHHQVLGLQVPVHDPGGMRLRQPVGRLRRDGEQLLQRQRARRQTGPAAVFPSTSSIAMNERAVGLRRSRRS